MIKLSVNPKPQLLGYHNIAFPLAIVSTDDNYIPWYYSNFIHISCPKNFLTSEIGGFNFFNQYFFMDYPQGFPHLKSHFVKRRLISEMYKGGVIQFIKDNLRNNRYVMTWIDEFDLSSSARYQKKHLFHDVLLYGYDDDSFYSLGFDKERRFSETSLPIMELGSLEETLPNWDIKLFIMERREDFSFEFDLELVIQSLNEHIFSINPMQHFRMLRNNSDDNYYGFEAYNCLLEYMSSDLRSKSSFDIRPFQILWEHKICMTQRIDYMITKGYMPQCDGFVADWRNLEGEFSKLRNMMLKYSLSGNKNLLMSGKKQLNEIMQVEKALIVQMIDMVSKNKHKSSYL